jgi:signal transduction histidine kinase/PAS domain-containing protein
MTDWPLKPHTTDIQPYVIYTREAKIVPDPANEPLINPRVLEVANLRPLAIVPILDRRQQGIGTIHVERADSLPPIEEEVQDLLFFGRQLAAVIEQSERVRVLQSALDQIPSPVALVDLDYHPWYANRPAADLFGICTGWRKAGTQTAAPQWGERLSEDLRECIKCGQRIVRHYRGVGKRPDYRGTALCDKIADWQGNTLGAVLHIDDLNYLEDIFEAFGTVAQSINTRTAYDHFLRVCLRLGAKWARFYLVDPHDRDDLVGESWAGEGAEEDKENFRHGTRFRRGVDPPFGWLAMDTHAPQVFCYRPDGVEGERFKTPAGLEVIWVTNPPPHPPKNVGDFWIDLPLWTPSEVLGKVTLHCDPGLLPERFEMLAVLAENAAALLGAFAQNERMVADREAYIKLDAAERVTASMAHNLNTRLAALPGILTLYKDAEKEAQGLAKVNRSFEHILQHALGTIGRAKDMLAAIVLRPTTFELGEALQRVLSSSACSIKWCLSAEPLDVEWDQHHIESAILELARNSCQADSNAQVDLSAVRFERDGTEWIRLVWSDHGPGIPAEFKQLIFEDFFTTKAKEQRGTGLGLWYVRRVVEAHGGIIWEDGVPGCGARFWIELPRRGPRGDKIWQTC